MTSTEATGLSIQIQQNTYGTEEPDAIKQVARKLDFDEEGCALRDAFEGGDVESITLQGPDACSLTAGDLAHYIKVFRAKGRAVVVPAPW